MLQRRLAPNLPRGFDDDLQLAFLVILIDQVTHHVRGKAALLTDRELFERHIQRGFVDPPHELIDRFQTRHLGAHQPQHHDFSLGQEAQRLEAARSRRIIFEQESVMFQVV